MSKTEAQRRAILLAGFLSDVRGTVRVVATDREILHLAGEWRKYAGTREQAMRDRFDMSDVQFWMRVNRIVDAPDRELALEFGPLLKRLREQREERMRRRSSRRAG